MKTLEITKKTILDCIALSPGKTMLTFVWKVPVIPQAIDMIEQHSSELGITVLTIKEGRKGIEINMPIQENESISELYLLVDKLIAIISCMFDMHNLVIESSIKYHSIVSRIDGIVKDFEHNESTSEQSPEGNCECAYTDEEEVTREQLYRVKLTYSGSQKLTVAKIVHDLCGLCASEARQLVDEGCGYVIEHTDRQTAISIKNALVEAGATANIEAEDDNGKDKESN